MPGEIPQPSVNATAFACPHCGAYARQHWFNALIEELPSSTRLPGIPSPEDVALWQAKAKERRVDEGAAELIKLLDWARKTLSGEAFIHDEKRFCDYQLANAFVSQCENCHRPSIWVHKRLIYPVVAATGVEPHPDLPEALKLDFEEARRIVPLSPRGAAALLRLVVQKLCVELGEKGKNIDDDIAALVSKGLDVTIQQALDAVRVIGNEAVHPGVMDLKDDQDTALLLLELINDITAQTLSRRKRAEALYLRIPEGKRKAIDQRNEKALNPGK